MDSPMLLSLFIVTLLIFLTAFFVAAEFSIVKVRSARLDQLVLEGNKKAVTAKKVIENIDDSLSASQFGITLSALGLGWIGADQIEKYIHTLVEQLNLSQSLVTFLSFLIAFLLIAFLHVVIGELVPKTLAVHESEKLTLLVARPLYVFTKLFYPFIRALNSMARLTLRLFGVQTTAQETAHSEEELKIIMTESFRSGEINENELAYVQNIFSFDERIAKDAMVPRMNMVTIDEEDTIEEIISVVEEHQYTRYPVTRDGDRDDVLGFVNAKQLFTAQLSKNDAPFESFIHQLPLVTEFTPLQEAMVKMQNAQTMMCLVIDEYGGTAGLLTIEDILEEIVGEIRDEFDRDEQAEITEVAPKHYRLSGLVLTQELEERFGIEIEDDVDTVGGFVLSQKANARTGERFTLPGNHELIVSEVDNHRIVFVDLILASYEEEEPISE
ncbi:MAG: hemolysin family protein [Exiguobacterium marinum]|uniref:Hemolysin family protein n=2 Tax=Exiguobacterium marinum TaxID=273528 RepID=A0ABY7X0I5_9BACL|nr:hemolysin family protein [Exiguobacterium marinum]WDH76097.1 hemolysin family protein [Exiguobacterium marinum]